MGMKTSFYAGDCPGLGSRHFWVHTMGISDADAAIAQCLLMAPAAVRCATRGTERVTVMQRNLERPRT